MDDVNVDLISAKKQIVKLLGGLRVAYFEHIRYYLRHEWTREDLEKAIKPFFTKETKLYHYDFIRALLNKIYTLQERPPSLNTFLQNPPIDPAVIATGTLNTKFVNSPELDRALSNTKLDEQIELQQNELRKHYYLQELFMPKAGFLYVRYVTTAWIEGLENVDDDAVLCTTKAVRVFLKDLIKKLIDKKKTWLATDTGPYAYGSDETPLYKLPRNISPEPGSFVRCTIQYPDPPTETNTPELCMTPYVIGKPRPITLTLIDLDYAFKDRTIMSSEEMLKRSAQKVAKFMKRK